MAVQTLTAAPRLYSKRKCKRPLCLTHSRLYKTVFYIVKSFQENSFERAEWLKFTICQCAFAVFLEIIFFFLCFCFFNCCLISVTDDLFFVFSTLPPKKSRGKPALSKVPFLETVNGDSDYTGPGTMVSSY